MSLYGYTTRTDLSAFGSFLHDGADRHRHRVPSSISSWNQARCSLRSLHHRRVIVFVGLTAYATQRIKAIYLESDTAETAGKKAVLGALSLYLDFINLFMMPASFVRPTPGRMMAVSGSLQMARF